ncbi:hypothetical protein VKT23_009834 [Stygiomarasmius scandens]|uniref:HMG box domain-containing protein n=1 Tax=Marasmiellus scandens TaxID=2682957 RepID=A0ABR1IQP3_9AGAR
MPAERSRGSRRTGADGTQLVWTLPVEPTSPGEVSFASNLTPITFNEPGPDGLASAPLPENNLFPFVDESTCPRRPAHSKKKPENHIPRPPNAFILFRSSFIKSQHVSTGVETNHSTLSKIIGMTWQNLPEQEKMVWHAQARAKLDEHKRKFPEYTFRPLHSKAKNEKRKVREVGRKDLKRCAKIAELLVEGKKGEELDIAIQEFDKTHVPEVVTRFEAPITERSFRQADETENDSDSEEEFVHASSASPPPSSYPSSRASSRCPSPVKSNRQQSKTPPSLDTQSMALPQTTPSEIDSTYPFNFFSSSSPQAEGTCSGFDPSHLAGAAEDTAPTRRPSLTINTSFNSDHNPFINNNFPSPDPSTFVPDSSVSIPQTPNYTESAFSEYPGYNTGYNDSTTYPITYPSSPVAPQPYNPYMSSSLESIPSSLPELSHSLPSSGSSSYEDLSALYQAHGSPVTPPSAMHDAPWITYNLDASSNQGDYLSDPSQQCKLEPTGSYFPDDAYANLAPEEFDLETLLKCPDFIGPNSFGMMSMGGEVSVYA